MSTAEVLSTDDGSSWLPWMVNTGSPTFMFAFSKLTWPVVKLDWSDRMSKPMLSSLKQYRVRISIALTMVFLDGLLS